MKKTVKKTSDRPKATVAADAGTLNRKYSEYIREKVNQLLLVMGSSSLKPEELDDDTLLDLDPIGIIAGSFGQVLEHLTETNRELTITHDTLQAIFDATGVGISIIDREFRILKYNEKQRTLLLDKGTGDVTGRYCHEVYCNKPSPGFDCPALDTMETGKAVIVREAAKKGKHFQIVTTPLKDGEGNVTGAIEVLLDISDTKRARDAEQEQRGFYLTEKSKLASILQSLSEGLFVTDREGSIVSFNNAAGRITGYAESQVLGQSCSSFLEKLGAVPGSLPDRGAGEPVDMAAVSRDKRLLTLAMSSVPLHDGNGQFSGTAYTFRDITAEKQRRENHYRTEKLAALGQLSAGIAHELNTPLGSILGYSRLLLQQELPAQDKERLGIIAEQAKRGSAIIKGLLNFARQSPPVLGETDINAVIADCIRVLDEEIEKRRCLVTTGLGKIPLLQADRRQVEQVIINVLQNALQAMPASGKIEITTAQSGQSVAIGIRDNGPGMPPHVRTRIFDPFFTTKPIGEGTGLGLSICAGIVSAHGGSMHVESEEGRGAAFTITLPVRPERIP